MEKSSRMIALLILYLAVLQQLCSILAAFNVTGVEKFIVTRRGYDTDLFSVVYKTCYESAYECAKAKVCGSTSWVINNTMPCSCMCKYGLYPTFLPWLGKCGDTATAKESLFGRK